MSNKHTPGPWFPVEYSGFWELQGDKYYGDPVVLDADDVGIETAEANAQLAAAAPELLQALQRLIACRYDSDKSIFEALEYAEQVIKPFQS